MRAAQRERLLNFIRMYTAANDESPTIREIGEFFGWSSPATVAEKLLTLERLGLITRSRKWRGIEIVNGD